MLKRQIILDTETTGINPKDGHRIIEIGCVELINRRFTGNNYHVYINPEREIEAEAIAVHGITNQRLQHEPKFRDIAHGFFEYIKGAELVIHNAAFDVGFIDHEFAMLQPKIPPVAEYCGIVDTLKLARDLHPGQKNNLDALCRRYDINNSHRTLHGALLDAEILADVYLLMTGGQVSLNLAAEDANNQQDQEGPLVIQRSGKLKVIKANSQELTAHQSRLDLVQKKGGSCLWRD
ncbi:DNA polymerase III subunit epsilon [Alishewanella sp. SMS8]|uniref:DNA polymerase III subunit epsilon n=1 Tax=Alishewanella sp. SMS8 TaxID=2994676 RepID=UPI0027417D2B|nr:DNA polymerase III subunit epsilon [Alishewanella sp. SMS8]MDP4945915.1 DNA polymerase III subunit epsilon [Alishewanella sp.]MDP5207400.1 DNA polymerase III subunit epsilon [Alishewanella sp. SMS9]MDP5036615.1 DNA polymerase III subunit epsilon [Alishewanella sp.]MDP5187526.1 DNA polymerase III subunit epsilon [Alishewanella sp.]MDP5460819.1 DNA polymerase III subunit epsilon [Alishewanella sp. SMS8]